MIRRTWKDPNYKFRARDDAGAVYEFFCYAESPEQLERPLRDKDLQIESIQPYDFSEWKARAARRSPLRGEVPPRNRARPAFEERLQLAE